MRVCREKKRVYICRMRERVCVCVTVERINDRESAWRDRL